MQVLSLFFSCNKPLMHLNLYKNGPLAVGFFMLPYKFSLFFSCDEPLMRLNLYKNGPLAVGFLLPYKFSLLFSCNEPLMCLNLYENDPPAVGFEVLPDFVAMQVITRLVLSLCAARLLVTASSVCFSDATSL